MKKIIDLIKKLLGAGTMAEKAVELQQLETEVVAEVAVVVAVVVNPPDAVPVIEYAVGTEPFVSAVQVTVTSVVVAEVVAEAVVTGSGTADGVIP